MRWGGSKRCSVRMISYDDEGGTSATQDALRAPGDAVLLAQERVQHPVPMCVSWVRESVVTIVAGSSHILCLTRRANVFALGAGEHGQLGLGKDILTAPQPIRIPQLCGVGTLTATGDRSACCLGSGEAFVWGVVDIVDDDVDYPPQWIPRSLRARLGEHRVTMVSLGHRHTLALTVEGKVMSWGTNYCRALGLPDVEADAYCSEPHPVTIPTDQPVRQVAARDCSSAVVTVSGKVYFWGEHWRPEHEHVTKPIRIRMPKHDGDTPPVGSSGAGSLPVPSGDIVHIAMGTRCVIAVTEANHVYSVGYGGKGQLGLGSTESQDTFQLLPFQTDGQPMGKDADTLTMFGQPPLHCRIPLAEGKDAVRRIAKVMVNGDTCVAVDDQGRLFTWGSFPDTVSDIGADHHPMHRQAGELRQSKPAFTVLPGSPVRRRMRDPRQSAIFADDETVGTDTAQQDEAAGFLLPKPTLLQEATGAQAMCAAVLGSNVFAAIRLRSLPELHFNAFSPPTVSGGSLEALVELFVTREPQDEELTRLEGAFFASLTMHSPVVDTCGAVVQLWSEYEQHQIGRLQVVAFVERWIEHQLPVLDPTTEASDRAAWLDLVRMLLSTVSQAKAISGPALAALVSRLEAPFNVPVIGEHVHAISSMDGVDMTADELFELSPDELARQLCTVDLAHFLDVPMCELVRGRWAAKDRHEHAPNIEALTLRFNECSRWVQQMLIDGSDDRVRSLRANKLCDVMQECGRLGDYAGVLWLMAALSSVNATRLQQAGRLTLSSKNIKALARWKDVLLRQNARLYRSALATALRDGQAVVPYFGCHLSDLTFLAELPKVKRNTPLINMLKFGRIGATLETLRAAQRARFAFAPGAASRFLCTMTSWSETELNERCAALCDASPASYTRKMSRALSNSWIGRLRVGSSSRLPTRLRGPTLHRRKASLARAASEGARKETTSMHASAPKPRPQDSKGKVAGSDSAVVQPDDMQSSDSDNDEESVDADQTRVATSAAPIAIAARASTHSAEARSAPSEPLRERKSSKGKGEAAVAVPAMSLPNSEASPARGASPAQKRPAFVSPRFLGSKSRPMSSEVTSANASPSIGARRRTRALSASAVSAPTVSIHLGHLLVTLEAQVTTPLKKLPAVLSSWANAIASTSMVRTASNTSISWLEAFNCSRSFCMLLRRALQEEKLLHDDETRAAVREVIRLCCVPMTDEQLDAFVHLLECVSLVVVPTDFIARLAHVLSSWRSFASIVSEDVQLRRVQAAIPGTASEYDDCFATFESYSNRWVSQNMARQLVRSVVGRGLRETSQVLRTLRNLAMAQNGRGERGMSLTVKPASSVSRGLLRSVAHRAKLRLLGRKRKPRPSPSSSDTSTPGAPHVAVPDWQRHRRAFYRTLPRELFNGFDPVKSATGAEERLAMLTQARSKLLWLMQRISDETSATSDWLRGHTEPNDRHDRNRLCLLDAMVTLRDGEARARVEDAVVAVTLHSPTAAKTNSAPSDKPTRSTSSDRLKDRSSDDDSDRGFLSIFSRRKKGKRSSRRKSVHAVDDDGDDSDGTASSVQTTDDSAHVGGPKDSGVGDVVDGAGEEEDGEDGEASTSSEEEEGEEGEEEEEGSEVEMDRDRLLREALGAAAQRFSELVLPAWRSNAEGVLEALAADSRFVSKAVAWHDALVDCVLATARNLGPNASQETYALVAQGVALRSAVSPFLDNNVDLEESVNDIYRNLDRLLGGAITNMESE